MPVYSIEWRNVIAVASHHIVAVLGILWFFSWKGVALALIGIYVFGILGINIGFHRLLTHRGFSCSKRLEYTLALLGVCCLQGTPAQWVAVHRRHHQHSDDRLDPHSPRDNIVWAHIGWLVFENERLPRSTLHRRYAKDILRDPSYARLEHRGCLAFVILSSWLVFFLGGCAAELLAGGPIREALRCGATILVWGVFVRIVIVWHISWSVNSVTHIWGYRNYPTDDGSRNNLLIGILAGGEGWHNNHHADPRSAKHGHFWWELDLTYLTIRLLAWCGLIEKIFAPRIVRAASPKMLVTDGDDRASINK